MASSPQPSTEQESLNQAADPQCAPCAAEDDQACDSTPSCEGHCEAQSQSQEAQSKSQEGPRAHSQEQPKSPREQTIKPLLKDDPEDVGVTQITNEHQTKSYKMSEQEPKPEPKLNAEPELVLKTREDHPEEERAPKREREQKKEMVICKEDSQARVEPEIFFNAMMHIQKDLEPCKWTSLLSAEEMQQIPGPPLSPPQQKSPWRKLDPYDSLEDDREYVGFATLPNQVHRKSVKKGFEFTLMVAGESGLGKSTLINSLFLTDLYKDRKLLNSEECISQTVDITKRMVEIEEKGVKLRLTVVDTPGYGDALNNTDCWKPIAEYVDQQFEQYFRDESGLNRKNILDNRVHCCLYFISPFAHGLRPLDVKFIKALHERVNIVPILAKADTLTPVEVERKKRKIREEIEHNGIQIYQFPDCDSDEDEEFKQQDLELKRSIPFAVIGSNTVVEVNGRRVRGRLYPWGVVEVENPSHSDFVKLRTMLVKTHMQDLKDVTRETRYENYRAQCIQSMTRMVVKERNRNKLTRESGTDFPIQTTEEIETEKLIREKDEELRRMQEMLHRIQRQMESQ